MIRWVRERYHGWQLRRAARMEARARRLWDRHYLAWYLTRK
ncbi:hypothetical protein [Brevibacillus borstelensis]|nr:hypothetical protein [Brevibacillus borstelensis]